MLKLVHDATAEVANDPEELTVSLDELCRLAAQDMIRVALLAERQAYLDDHADLVDGAGRRLVVGNGYARPRPVTTAAGAIEVKPPESMTAGKGTATGR